MEITSNTRIIDLTVGQLMELFAKAQAPATITEAPETANRIKASGRIDDAITQHGRIIVVDADKALVLFNNK